MENKTFTRMRNLLCWLVNSLIVFNLLGGGCSVNADHVEVPTHCSDTASDFNLWIRQQQTEVNCMDVQSNSVLGPTLCNYLLFKRKCPETCNSCPHSCEDEDFPVSINGDFKYCHEVRAANHRLCNNYEFAYNCPETCQFCPENDHHLGENCIDTNSDFTVSYVFQGILQEQITKNCDSAINQFWLCDTSTFKRRCPETCESCPKTCADTTSSVSVDERMRSCEDADNNWGHYLCDDYEFAHNCPETCHFCPIIPNPPVNDCLDSENNFIISEEVDGEWVQVRHHCDWYDYDRDPWLCDHNIFSSKCPETCGTCPETCEDKSGLVFIDGALESCDDANNNRHNLCKSYEFAKHCANTCDFCPEIQPVGDYGGEYCVNSVHEFMISERNRYGFWEYVWETCNSAENDRSSLCDHNQFKRRCPETCGTCPDKCEDKGGLVGVDGFGEKCSNANDNWKDSLCGNFKFAKHCSETCHFCPIDDPVDYGEYCVNYEDEFVVTDPDDDDDDSGWYETCDKADDDETICHYDEVKRRCPETCGTCPDKCEDKGSRVVIDGHLKSCDDADDNWKHSLCGNFKFAKYCSETCHFCPKDETPSPPGDHGEYCHNSNLDLTVFIKDQGYVTKTCRSAVDETSLCNKFLFKRRCAETCDTCPAKCEDSAEPIMIGRIERTCKAAENDSNYDLCDNFKFAEHCAKTCHFCHKITDSQKFVLKDEESGNAAKSYFGDNAAISTGGNQIIVTEIDDGNTFLYEYHRNTKKYSTIKRFNFGGRYTELAVSKDGMNLIFAYETMFDEGKIYISRQKNSHWSDRGSINFMGELRFGFVVKISDDGDTVMIADKYNVYVFENKSQVGKRWKMRGNDDGISFARAKTKILDASMSANAQILAVALTKPNHVRFFIWKKNRWKNHGRITGAAYGKNLAGIFTTVDLAANGKTLFTGMTFANDGFGVVRVFDFHKNSKKRWQPWVANNGIVMKGEQDDERLGKGLSVSSDGNTVAWASKTRAGVVRWNGKEWLDQLVESEGEDPTVTLDANGKYLVVGLPNADGEDELLKAGKLQTFVAEKVDEEKNIPSSAKSSKSQKSPKSSKR